VFSLPSRTALPSGTPALPSLNEIGELFEAFWDLLGGFRTGIDRNCGGAGWPWVRLSLVACLKKRSSMDVVACWRRSARVGGGLDGSRATVSCPAFWGAREEVLKW